MPDAICDTGPLLHLYEIDRLKSLGIFAVLRLPDLVAEELRVSQLDLPQLSAFNFQIALAHLQDAEWGGFLNEPEQPLIHAADAQVFALAHAAGFQTMVLTDDLALRRKLEQRNAPVAGSIGVLVRSHTQGQMSYDELTAAIEALFTSSSLHLSRGFRAYIRQLLADLR